MSKPTKETVNFGEVATQDWKTVGNISDIRDEEIQIVHYELIQNSKREIAIIDIIRIDGTEEKRHTFSGVLIKQLKQIESILRNKYVLAKVTKRKNYYTFE